MQKLGLNKNEYKNVLSTKFKLKIERNLAQSDPGARGIADAALLAQGKIILVCCIFYFRTACTVHV